MAVDFTPTLVGYSNQEKLRFWCQKVLPLVYDDSLSYYELLNKVVVYLNNAIQDVANAETNIDSLFDSYQELQDYVNSFGDEISAIDENVAAALQAKVDAQSAKADAESAKDDAETAKADAEAAKEDAETAKEATDQNLVAIQEIAEDFNNSRWEKFLPPTVKGINHRGYSITAPENTFPAFRESLKHGFKYVETDIRKTSDGVYVLLHDETINRTGRNADGSAIAETINITSITYEQALTYDFGIFKGTKFAGTKIPRLIDFLDFCKNCNIYPYMELEMTSLTDSDIEPICDLIRRYNMQNVATLISFTKTALQHVVEYEPSFRVGLLANSNNRYDTDDAADLKTATNNVVLDAQISFLTDNVESLIAGCINNRIELECWTPDLITQVINVLPYVSGITSDSYNASEVGKELNNFVNPTDNLPTDGIINQFFNIANIYKKYVGNHVTEINGNHVRYFKENADTPSDYYLISLTGKPYHADATVSQDQYNLICEAAKIPIISATSELDLEVLEEYFGSDSSSKMAYGIYLGTIDSQGVATVASKNRNPIPNIGSNVFKMAPPSTFIDTVNANKNICAFFYSRGGGSEFDELRLTLSGIKGCIIDNSFNA